MNAQILPFPKPPAVSVSSPVALFLRVGEAHRKLADLHATGHLPARRAVFDASRVRHQRDLIAALRDAGAEIVLDTEAAELAAVGKCSGHVRRAPWARPQEEGVLGPTHFRREVLPELMGQIARFAVEHRFNAVLSPTHYLGDPGFGDWFTVDRAACLALRQALDREGGRHIGIDYPLILQGSILHDHNARGAITSALADLPVENIWLRVSPLGVDAGPLSMQRFLTSTSALHNLGKPLIADHLGGLPSLAAAAFGAVSGVAQGIGERERFDASGWHKPPQQRADDDPFGRAVRIGIPSLWRSLLAKELDLLAGAKGGRRLCGCGDRSCCPHGYADMRADPRGHTARQLFKSFAALEAIPDLRRETHFINGPMAEADRLARQVKELRPSAPDAAAAGVDVEKLMKRLADQSRGIEKLRIMLERHHEARGEEGPRCRPVVPRASTESEDSSRQGRP